MVELVVGRNVAVCTADTFHDTESSRLQICVYALRERCYPSKWRETGHFCLQSRLARNDDCLRGAAVVAFNEVFERTEWARRTTEELVTVRTKALR
jgi:hypothetical protein